MFEHNIAQGGPSGNLPESGIKETWAVPILLSLDASDLLNAVSDVCWLVHVVSDEMAALVL